MNEHKQQPQSCKPITKEYTSSKSITHKSPNLHRKIKKNRHTLIAQNEKRKDIEEEKNTRNFSLAWHYEHLILPHANRVERIIFIHFISKFDARTDTHTRAFSVRQMSTAFGSIENVCICSELCSCIFLSCISEHWQWEWVQKRAIQVYCSIVRLNIFRIIFIFVVPVILKRRASTFHMIYFCRFVFNEFHRERE